MKKIISAQWKILTPFSRKLLYEENLEGVTVLPNDIITNELEKLNFASLECLENRTNSTTYRVRQTGKIFEVKNNKSLSSGELLATYEVKNLAYIVELTEDKIFIERKKYPRFKGYVVTEPAVVKEKVISNKINKMGLQIETKEVEQTVNKLLGTDIFISEWLDITTEQKQSSVIKKGIEFLRKNLIIAFKVDYETFVSDLHFDSNPIQYVTDKIDYTKFLK